LTINILPLLSLSQVGKLNSKLILRFPKFGEKKINSRVEVIARLLVDDPRRPVHYLYDNFEVAAGHAGHGGVKLEFTLIARAEELGAGEVHDALASGLRLRD
jgi:hypothetical protein